MGILEKISEIEKEIARTQKNKGIFFSHVDQNFAAEFTGSVWLVTSYIK